MGRVLFFFLVVRSGFGLPLLGERLGAVRLFLFFDKHDFRRKSRLFFRRLDERSRCESGDIRAAIVKKRFAFDFCSPRL